MHALFNVLEVHNWLIGSFVARDTQPRIESGSSSLSKDETQKQCPKLKEKVSVARHVFASQLYYPMVQVLMTSCRKACCLV